jgi:hypothetical protein
VFVIRIWWEPAAGGGRRRGYVEHVASRQRFYFSDIGDALEFVAALGASPPAGDDPCGNAAIPANPTSLPR